MEFDRIKGNQFDRINYPCHCLPWKQHKPQLFKSLYITTWAKHYSCSLHSALEHFVHYLNCDLQHNGHVEFELDRHCHEKESNPIFSHFPINQVWHLVLSINSLSWYSILYFAQKAPSVGNHCNYFFSLLHCSSSFSNSKRSDFDSIWVILSSYREL